MKKLEKEKTISPFCLILLTIIAALLGMVTACEDPDKSVSQNSSNDTYYTVSFEANGGSPAPQSQTVSHGDYVTEPEFMTTRSTSDGVIYGFGGWYKEAKFINLWDFTTDVVTGNITLYAKWDRNYYTVTFYDPFNPSSNGHYLTRSYRIAYGGKVSKPQDRSYFMHEEWYLEGWYKEAAYINLWNFATDTVTANINLYSKWVKVYYTVRFEANGGSPSPQNQTVSHGDYVTEPASMTKAGYSFDGWYKEAACINQWNFYGYVTANITLYAKWVIPGVVKDEIVGGTLADKFQWIYSNAESHSIYILEVSGDEPLGPQNLSFIGKNNITIQLTGIGGVRTIEPYGGGGFTIGGGVTLSLENIVLKDGSVQVESGGNLIMNNGSKITDGSVFLSITREYVNGNYLWYSGTFTMNGGKISGGGVYASGDYNYNTGTYAGETFTMNGGEISASSSYRGGVYISNGTFTMNGGEISGNTASSSGGGVYVNGTFTMTGGKISGNIANVNSSYDNYGGGGVYVNGTFTMTGGEISGNTIMFSSDNYYNNSSYGGGVYVNGTFTMTGGEISGNTISSDYYNNNSYGGGVYVTSDSSFEKTGGIITGYPSGPVNGNAIKDYDGNILDNRGHAVYVDHNNSRFVRRKETTAGGGDNLKYIRNEPNPPTISGAWDTDN